MNQKSKTNFLHSFKKYFKFDEYKAVFKKEIIGGLSTFVAMAYILIVNPSIVSGAEGAGEDLKGGLFLTTALCSFFATMLMGLYARIPVALAPGMGINIFFVYNVANIGGIGFNSALVITIFSGILYFILAMTPARDQISKVIPTNLKLAIGVGIGFFVAYIGLQDARIIVTGQGLVSSLGDFSHPLVLLSICLMIIGFILHYSKIQGAIIITMLLGALILLPMIASGYIKPIGSINPVEVGYKGFDKFGDVVAAAWKGFTNIKMWTNPITYIATLAFLYMDFFDTTGTLIAIDKTLKISEKDEKWMAKSNLVDALGTITGASLGSTSITAYIESTVGIASGAKTGFASVVTSLMLLLSIPLWPVLQIFFPINYEGVAFKPITSPVLVIVGTMMITQIRHFEWEITIDIPTLFVTVMFMMLSNSIATGIAVGSITFVILNAAIGSFQSIFKRKKKVVNSMEITTTEHSGPSIKTREFYYLKRLNITLIVMALVSIAYLVVETGINYLDWFKN